MIYLSLFLSLLGWFLYIFEIVNKTKVLPHPIPWFMSLLSSSVVITNVYDESIVYLYIVSWIFNLLILVYTIYKHKILNCRISYVKKDLIIMLVGFFVILVYFKTHYPMIMPLYYVLTYLASIHLVLTENATEPLVPWVVWLLGGISQLYVAISLSESLYFPITNVLCWLGLTISILLIKYKNKHENYLTNC